jgi:hypothetical protein
MRTSICLRRIFLTWIHVAVAESQTEHYSIALTGSGTFIFVAAERVRQIGRLETGLEDRLLDVTDYTGKKKQAEGRSCTT